jgi:steroid 5-alpha reductase family enzyme
VSALVLELVVCLACAAAAVVPMGLAWAASLPLRDASIADVAWGPTVTAVAWTAYASGDGNDRSLLIAVLVSLWGARIALHIGVRNLGHGEDRRYAALRERDGERFPLRSLWSIFGIQAGLAWVVGLPRLPTARRLAWASSRSPARRWHSPASHAKPSLTSNCGASSPGPTPPAG